VIPKEKRAGDIPADGLCRITDIPRRHGATVVDFALTKLTGGSVDPVIKVAWPEFSR
jgi:hypothetical protein